MEKKYKKARRKLSPSEVDRQKKANRTGTKYALSVLGLMFIIALTVETVSIPKKDANEISKVPVQAKVEVVDSDINNKTLAKAEFKD